MNKNQILFSFDKVKTAMIKRSFKRAGLNVVAVDISEKKVTIVKEKHLVKEIKLTFEDEQTVRLMIKESGDVYQVFVNKSSFPIHNQDDHHKAVDEIVEKLESSKARFKKALEKAKTPIKRKISVSSKSLLSSLKLKKEGLVDAISIIDEQIEVKRKEIKELK